MICCHFQSPAVIRGGLRRDAPISSMATPGRSNAACSMESIAPLDVIAAHPWKRAFFTTYALGASFTEAVVVEALLRRGVEHITILSDAAGMRMALREEGAVRIGREYSLEPVTVRNGCFHPKIALLWSEDRSHVL